MVSCGRQVEVYKCANDSILTSYRHWELHEPTVTQRNGEEHGFNVKMSATHDVEDSYQVASAQGVVRCYPENREIRVLNYIYDVTTDT